MRERAEARPVEFRVRSTETVHVTALCGEWMPASLGRLVEEARALAKLRDETMVLEVRWRKPRPAARRRG